ncbi:hypothetical protein J4E05_12605 [Thalassospira sp. NFXS8]|uniref:hypothetical protein n=1 Tax=Thalassospira sp. NFXS8 TaxID=2819093 RepID=UPI0032E00690
MQIPTKHSIPAPNLTCPPVWQSKTAIKLRKNGKKTGKNAIRGKPGTENPVKLSVPRLYASASGLIWHLNGNIEEITARHTNIKTTLATLTTEKAIGPSRCFVQPAT